MAQIVLCGTGRYHHQIGKEETRRLRTLLDLIGMSLDVGCHHGTILDTVINMLAYSLVLNLFGRPDLNPVVPLTLHDFIIMLQLLWTSARMR